MGLSACGEKEAPVAAVSEQPERTCSERAEGGVIRPKHGRDSIAGSVAFYVARANFNSTLGPLERDQEVGSTGWSAIKVLALVKTSDAVAVVVPRSERRWLTLNYRPNQRMESTIRLVPCERSAESKEQIEECDWEPVDACRSGVTQFNGAIVVNFAKAPRNGKCARIRVSNDAGESRSLYLFSDPESCLLKKQTVAEDARSRLGQSDRRCRRTGPEVTRAS